MENRMEEQLKEIAELHEKNKALYQQIGMCQETLVKVEMQLKCQEHKYDQLSAEYENYKAEQLCKLEKRDNTIRELERELAICTENQRRLGETIGIMENSLSWKLTKPLRYLRWMQLKAKDGGR